MLGCQRSCRLLHRFAHCTNKIHVKVGRFRLANIICVFFFLFLMVIWPQQMYDVIFAGPHLIWYKYMTANRSRFMCVKLQGGVGNMLFQYTFAYSMAKRSNANLVCQKDKMSELQEIFNVPNCSGHSLGNRLCHGQLLTFPTSLDVGFDRELDKMHFHSDTHFLGYFQSWKYWGRYENTFRQQLTIREDVKAKTNGLINSHLKQLGYSNRSYVTLVGVHIRRGDMLKTLFKNFGYNVVTKDYIAKAKHYIRERVKGPIVYIVCSNDMSWTKEVITDPNAVFFEGNSREVDFAALAMCDHFVISTGTFGWWAAWHVRGIVVYYNKPFRSGSGLAKVYSKDYVTSYYYPGWIGMS